MFPISKFIAVFKESLSRSWG